MWTERSVHNFIFPLWSGLKDLCFSISAIPKATFLHQSELTAPDSFCGPASQFFLNVWLRALLLTHCWTCLMLRLRANVFLSPLLENVPTSVLLWNHQLLKQKGRGGALPRCFIPQPLAMALTYSFLVLECWSPAGPQGKKLKERFFTVELSVLNARLSFIP